MSGIAYYLPQSGTGHQRLLVGSDRWRDGELQITLDDDGPGIAEGERQRVLYRGERADEQVPGSGLGLAIVVDLTRLYGGRVDLDASPLGGLRVRLSLPAAV